MELKCLISVNEADVYKAIKRLKPKKSLGHDNIPAYVYKGLIDFLTPPLTHIINLSISKSKYVKIWEVTKVTPVPKDDLGEDIANHRPIALSTVPAKIFESIIHE